MQYSEEQAYFLKERWPGNTEMGKIKKNFIFQF